MTIIGLREAVRLVEDPANGGAKTLREYLDSSKKGENKGWHPEDASVLSGLKPDDRQNVLDTIRGAPLSKMLEYAIASGTTGIAGN